MKERLVYPLEYGFDAASALYTRLGVNARITALTEGAAGVVAHTGALAAALTDILFDECAKCELVRTAELFQYDEFDTARIVRAAYGYARKRLNENAPVRTRTKEALSSYLEGNTSLNLPGYMRFRMREVHAYLSLSAEKAADTLLLAGEYSRLVAVLAEFAARAKAISGELTLLLNADGSCTLNCTDCALASLAAKERGLIGTLLALSPESIVVYDLSCGRSSLVYEVVSRIFRGRVKVIR